MSVYSNTEILQAIKDGIIVSEPFYEKHISEASLDITLGYYYYKVESRAHMAIYNPFDEKEVADYFDGPEKAMKHKDWCDKYGYAYFNNIPLDHPIIVLRPGERILAHTHEFVGIKANGGACEVRSRSSWGRNGIAVCFDAGWIDPGYINRITLEVYNLNKYESVVIPVGERIGQIIFHHTDKVKGSYEKGRNGMSGKYQKSDNLSDLIANWHPSQMLPRAFKDKRVLPQEIKGLPKDIK